MIRFLVGFILGIYVSLYGVSAVIEKVADIYNQIVIEVEEQDETPKDPDINI